MADEIKVFVSSPADVRPEREALQRVVNRINAFLGRERRLNLYRWEDGHYYTAASGFQRQIPETGTFDLVIGILGHRIGSPLIGDWPTMPNGERYPSGTAYELLTAIAASRESPEGRPDVYVFRKTAPATLSARREERKITQAQLDALDRFVEEVFVTAEGEFRGAYQHYPSVDAFERDVEGCLRGWLAGKGHLDAQVTWSISERKSPFRGLEAFDREHAPVFFGRDEAVRRLCARILGTDDAPPGAAPGLATGFALVVGASGSGKSSLARAGLIPRLTGPVGMPVVDLWRVAMMRPGRSPATSLAEALFARPAEQGERVPDPVVGQQRQERGADRAGQHLGMAHELATGDFADAPALAAQICIGGGLAPIQAALKRAAAAEQEARNLERPLRARLLLLVDQCEELFAGDVPAQERAAIVALLDGLARGGAGLVMATLRADAYADLLADPVLLALREEGVEHALGPPADADFVAIIRGPAEAAGLSFGVDPKTGLPLDQALIEELRAAGRDADVLPLLQFALSEVYERSDAEQTRELSGAVYRELGGLEGTIGAAAERAFLGFTGTRGASPETLAQLSLLLRGLVRVEPRQSGFVLRETPERELGLSEVGRGLVAALLKQRLLVAGAERGAPTLRLAHEAILRSWRRAADLLEAERRYLLIREIVAERHAEWSGKARPSHLLLPAIYLDEARAMLARYPGEIAVDVAAYVAASRRRHALARGAAIAAMLLIGAASLGMGAFWMRSEALRKVTEVERAKAIDQARRASAAEQEAVEQRDRATAGRNTAEAFARKGAIDNLLAGQNALAQEQMAIVLGRAAEEPGWTPRPEFVATAAWSQSAVMPNAVLPFSAKIGAFSHDGSALAVVSESGEIAIHDARSWVRIHSVNAGYDVRNVAFSPDGKRLLVWHPTNRISLHDIGGSQVWTFDAFDGPVTGAAFVDGGSRIILTTGDGGREIILLDVASRSIVARQREHTAGVFALAISPDSAMAVTAGGDGRILGWSTRDLAPVHEFRAPTSRRWWISLAFSPDGEQLAVGGDGAAFVFAAGTGAPLRSLTLGDASIVQKFAQQLAFIGTRSLAVSVSKEIIDVFDTSTGEKTAKRRLKHQVMDASGSVLTAVDSETGQLVIWRSDEEPRRLAYDSTAATGVLLSPEGTSIVALGSRAVAVWRTDALADRVVVDIDRQRPEATRTALSRTGLRVAIVPNGQSSFVEIWSLATRTKVSSVALAPNEVIRELRWAGDGRLIVLTWRGVVVVQTDTGAQSHRFDYPAVVENIDADASGRHLSAALRGGRLELRDLDDGRLVAEMGGLEQFPSVHIADDGRHVAGSWDTKTSHGFQILRLADKVVRRFETPLANTTAFGGFIDDALFVIAERGGSVAVIDVASLSQIGVIPAEGGPIQQVFVRGDQIVILSEQGVGRLVDRRTLKEVGRLSLRGSLRHGWMSRNDDILIVQLVSQRVVGFSLALNEIVWSAPIPRDANVVFDRKSGLLTALERDGRATIVDTDRLTDSVVASGHDFVGIWPKVAARLRASAFGPSLLGDPALATVRQPVTDPRLSSKEPCDVLAANPNDPDRTAPGVNFSSMAADQAVEACRRATVAEPENGRFRYQLARALSAAKRHEEHLAALREGIALGYRYAVLGLALAHAQGNGVARDMTEAVRLAEEAASSGLTAATREIGNWLSSEALGAPDHAAARGRFERAAAQGDMFAHEALARIYAEGRHTARDLPRALRHLTFAVALHERAGHPEAAALKLWRASFARTFDLDLAARYEEEAQAELARLTSRR